MRNFLLLALFLSLSVLAAGGTFLPQGLNRPRPARLRVDVTYQGGQTKVQNATVELMDAVGGSSAMDKQISKMDFRDAMARVCAPVTIVTTTSDRAASAAGVWCAVAPDATSGSVAAARRAHTPSSCPPSRTCLAMGRPITPRPMNPTLIAGSRQQAAR